MKNINNVSRLEFDTINRRIMLNLSENLWKGLKMGWFNIIKLNFGEKILEKMVTLKWSI